MTAAWGVAHHGHMKMTPGQQEVAETVMEQLAELGPMFNEAHREVTEAQARRTALRERMRALVQQGQAVNANMTDLARAAGVTRQSLYNWLKEG